MPQIEYLWWAECPSHDEGAELLRAAIAAEELDVPVASIEVTSEDEAQRLQFIGPDQRTPDAG